jgi:excinuclease ABC A subunit
MVRVDPESIEVVGANANNLRDVDVSFPVGGVSMVVGVSGSGKSSLLGNTLAREGNLRLRTFLGVGQDHLDPPMSSAFVGRMPPTLHLGQRAFRASSRTTVGTSSGLLSLLRRMFVRWSTPVSERSGKPVLPPSVESYTAWLLEQHRGSVKVWAIPISFVASDGVAMAERLRGLGFSSVIVRSETDSPKRWEMGRVIALDKFKPLAAGTRYLIETEVGSVNLGKRTKATRKQLEQLLSLAFEAGEGRVFVELEGADAAALDSRRHWVIPEEPLRYRPASEHLLSFNAPGQEASGACPECRGLGRSTTLNIEALVVRPDLSMHEGAFALWAAKNYKYINIQHETIEGLRGLRGFSPDLPWAKLSDDARRLVLEGAGDELIIDRERGSGRKMSKPRRFDGFRSAILERVGKRGATAERLAFLVGEGPCPSCHGSRWSASARALRLGGHSIDQLLALSFAELSLRCAPDSTFAQVLPEDAAPYLAQLHRLAESFVGVGLDHISGARGMLEISEGESRRLRLAATLDGRHSGLCLLLDEPARGLHDEDVDRLSATLAGLRGTHSLILNEHRRRLAAAADFFVELGPGAGPHGGKVVHAGKVPKSWWRADSGLEREPRPVQQRGPKLKIEGAQVNNLQGVDVEIPLGHLVCVVGVSGSGKSSFVRGVLVPALAAAFEISSAALDFDIRRGRWTSLSGAENLGGLIALDQRAPAANRRSTVATFLGLAETLRSHYAKLPAAAAAGLRASDFGLNAGEGRCDECLGIGEIEEAGHWVTCPSCGGARFGATVLAVLDGGYDVAQILERSIASLCAEPLFAFDGALPLLQTIDELGVGHLSLGRRLDTISGGELQRLRIASELSERSRERLMFVLDEPAAGLHRDDVARLLRTLDRIVRDGHSVVVVEHNLELVAASDWVIEFGPGSGPRGGQLIAEGTPSELREQDTASGRMLRATPKPAKLSRRAAHRQIDAPPSQAEAASALRWLRRLLGDDVPPQEQELEHEGARPAVVVDAGHFGDRRVLEYGGLDRELASLMLECKRAADPGFDASAMLDAWEAAPNAQLRIHPLIRELYVWGPRVPASAIQQRREQLAKQGLEWLEHEDLARLRALGGPLMFEDASDRDARARLVESALLLGGGYVELSEGSKLLATHVRRSVDLERGLVGPHSASAHDFDRHSVRGRCPCCKGRGQVLGYDPSLVLGDGRKPVESNGFLHPGALAVLKGVHRNVLSPFFRRMIKEELWPADRPVAKLAVHERELLLHGFWGRPGPGSFLRTAMSNPKEVASWLRWDGLFAHVRANASRGAQQWREALLATEQMIDCPVCAGLGLRRHVSSFELAGRGYADWLATGTVAELRRALTKLASPNARSERRRERLVEVLAAFGARKLGSTKLRELIVDGPWTILAPAVVCAFTDMPVLTPGDA